MTRPRRSSATAEPVTDKLATLPMGDKIPTVPSLDAVNAPGVDAIGGSPAAGNRVNGDLVVPVDVSGNAVAIVGKAEVANDSEQSAEAWRDVETDGSRRLPRPATPWTSTGHCPSR